LRDKVQHVSLWLFSTGQLDFVGNRREAHLHARPGASINPKDPGIGIMVFKVVCKFDGELRLAKTGQAYERRAFRQL
jgi:hypothetical protein